MLVQQLNTELLAYAASISPVMEGIVAEPMALYGAVFHNKMLLSKIINRGLPHFIFDTIKNICPFSDSNWADYLDVSVKTLQRNREERNFIFKRIHSEKILELAEAIQVGLDVFDNPKQFFLWLELPSVALGNVSPAELIKDSFGRELVLEELIRIEHGVFA